VWTWLAGVDPQAIEELLIRRFVLSQQDIGVVDFEKSAAILLEHLSTTATGWIWNAVHRGPVG